MRRLAAGLILLLAGCGPRLDPRIRWVVEFGDVVAAAPSLGPDGTIYVGSHDHTFAAISPAGERLWSATARDFVHAPAAVSDRGIVVGAFDGRVYCFDTAGRERWHRQTDDRIVAGVAVDRQGNVYAPSADRQLYALDAEGALRWTWTASEPLESSPLALPGGDVIVAGSGDAGLVTRLDRRGAPVWQRPVGSEVFGCPAPGADETILVATMDAGLVCLSADGVIRWRYDELGKSVSSPAVGADGTIYVGDQTGDLHAVSAEGEPRWRFSTFTAIASSPTLAADGRVWFGSDSHAVYAVDVATGKLALKVPVSGYIASSPTIAPDGTLYIGDNAGRLYAIATGGGGLDATALWPHLRGGPAGLGRR